MPTFEPNELPWRPAQQVLVPLAEAAEPITTWLGERLPMNIFENIRKAIVTLLRAEKVEFEPPPLALARGALRRRIDRVEIKASGVPIENTKVVIDLLIIVAEDVRLRLARRPTFDIGHATYQVRLTQEQLSELVPLPTGVDRVSVSPRGFTFHTIAGLPIYTAVSLQGSQITVSPTTPHKVPLLDLVGINIDMPQLPAGSGLEQLTRIGLSFDLPELPAGAKLEELDLYDGYVEISGSIELAPAIDEVNEVADLREVAEIAEVDEVAEVVEVLAEDEQA